MSICGGCGKLIDSKFYYCPWCGYSRVAQDKEEALELRCKQIKDQQLESQFNHIERLGQQLDNLERELSVLVLSAEMHK